MRRAEPADLVGAATLERMAAAPRYNRWMYERLRPWVGRRVLEIGAGIGNMSAFLIDRDRVVLTDTEPYYLDRLRRGAPTAGGPALRGGGGGGGGAPPPRPGAGGRPPPPGAGGGGGGAGPLYRA